MRLRIDARFQPVESKMWANLDRWIPKKWSEKATASGCWHQWMATPVRVEWQGKKMHFLSSSTDSPPLCIAPCRCWQFFLFFLFCLVNIISPIHGFGPRFMGLDHHSSFFSRWDGWSALTRSLIIHGIALHPWIQNIHEWSASYARIHWPRVRNERWVLNHIATHFITCLSKRWCVEY